MVTVFPTDAGHRRSPMLALCWRLPARLVELALNLSLPGALRLLCLLAVGLRFESCCLSSGRGLLRSTIVGYGTSSPTGVSWALRSWVQSLHRRHVRHITASPFVFIEVPASARKATAVFSLNVSRLIAASQINACIGRRYTPTRRYTSRYPRLRFRPPDPGRRVRLRRKLWCLSSHLRLCGLPGDMPNTAVLAMAPFGRNAGSASALGTLQFALAPQPPPSPEFQPPGRDALR